MIVVTGGAGFIGSAIVWELNKLGKERILIVDELGNNEKWKNLRSLRYSDFMNKHEFIEHIQKDSVPFEISAIIHMGACSSTTETDASYLISNNYEYSKFLAKYAHKSDIRFIYASSAATYGDGVVSNDKVLFPDDPKFLNDLRPLNMYGYSKHLFDKFLNQKGYLKKMVGLKFFNVFGPNEYHKTEMSSKIYKAFFEIKENGYIKLFKSANKDWKDGEFVRDFIYVKDVVKIITELLAKPYINGLFNVGSGKSRSWNDLANAVCKSMNRNPEIKYIEMPEYLKEKYQYFTEADNSKLKATGIDINYTSLEDAVDDYIKNYLIAGKHLGDEHLNS